MNQLQISIKKELMELFRSKKILILAILFLFVSVSSPILAKLIPTIFKTIPGIGEITIPDATWRDAIDQFIKNANQFIGIVIVFMFAGAIAEEKNKKTLEIVLTKPISRAKFLLGKYFSGFTALALGMLAGSAIFYYYAVSIFGSFSINNFAFLSLFLFVYFVLIFALTIFASTISGSQLVAIALAFFVEIIFATVLNYVDAIKNYLPTYIVSHYKDLMSNGNIRDFLPSIYVSLALIVLLVIASISIFKRQEIER